MHECKDAHPQYMLLQLTPHFSTDTGGSHMYGSTTMHQQGSKRYKKVHGVFLGCTIFSTGVQLVILVFLPRWKHGSDSPSDCRALTESWWRAERPARVEETRCLSSVYKSLSAISCSNCRAVEVFLGSSASPSNCQAPCWGGSWPCEGERNPLTCLKLAGLQKD